MRGEVPDFREWSTAAVWLLKGVVYADDARLWNLTLSNVSALETYFARLGLKLIVDESEGMAYLRQFTESEVPDAYSTLPKLFRSSRFSYPQTLLCVLLRDELRRFDEEDLRNERCVVEESVLLDQWRAYFPAHDDVRGQRDLLACLHRLESLGLVRKFGDAPSSWEVRRILKARLPASELERLRDLLANATPQSEAIELPHQE